MTHGGFSVNGVHTRHGLGLCVADRQISAPTKKTVRVTVPFMNGSYDFSDVYGGVFFEDRTLTYTFDIIADTTEELEEHISLLTEFVSFIQEGEIQDDDISGYHYLGSFSSVDITRDDSGLGATAKVEFVAHPFMFANEATTYTLAVGSTIVHNSGQATRVTATPSGDSAKITYLGISETILAETQLQTELPSGNTEFTVEGSAVTISYNETRL